MSPLMGITSLGFAITLSIGQVQVRDSLYQIDFESGWEKRTEMENLYAFRGGYGGISLLECLAKEGRSTQQVVDSAKNILSNRYGGGVEFGVGGDKQLGEHSVEWKSVDISGLTALDSLASASTNGAVKELLVKEGRLYLIESETHILMMLTVPMLPVFIPYKSIEQAIGTLSFSKLPLSVHSVSQTQSYRVVVGTGEVSMFFLKPINLFLYDSRGVLRLQKRFAESSRWVVQKGSQIQFARIVSEQSTQVIRF